MSRSFQIIAVLLCVAAWAVGETHWSFQPIKRPDVPHGEGNPVDAFLVRVWPRLGCRRTAGLGAGPCTPGVDCADGLPPTPEEVQAFEARYAKDPEQAYIKLVEEQLGSKHFGERWAQHWLDVIRWAETNGSEANLYRKMAWVYRDYVVRAFNEDLSYDQFVREQLAGDTLGRGEATGFL